MHTFREFVELDEIERLAAGYFRGGKQTLDDIDDQLAFADRRMPMRSLRGHPGFGVRVSGPMRWNDDDRNRLILLYDLTPKAHGYRDTTRRYKKAELASPTFRPLIGALIVYQKMSVKLVNGPTVPVYGVDAVTLDEQDVYRGQGLGLALYRLAIVDNGWYLTAGEEQTPAGRALWVRLASQPDIQVDGCFELDDEMFDAPTPSRTIPDELFGKIGVDYVGKIREADSHFFTFPVQPAQTKASSQELTAVLKHRWTTLYPSGKSAASPDFYQPDYVSLLARKKSSV